MHTIKFSSQNSQVHEHRYLVDFLIVSITFTYTVARDEEEEEEEDEEEAEEEEEEEEEAEEEATFGRRKPIEWQIVRRGVQWKIEINQLLDGSLFLLSCVSLSASFTAKDSGLSQISRVLFTQLVTVLPSRWPS